MSAQTQTGPEVYIRTRTSVLLGAVVFIALAATLFGCGPEPDPVVVQVTATPSIAPLVVLETIEDTEVTDHSELGKVEVDYPVCMSPGSSNILVLKIYILGQLASLDMEPAIISRNPIPPDAPRIVGKHGSFNVTILVSDTMRVELSSPTFRVVPHYPPTRQIDITAYNVENVWAWDIVAPNTFGLHILTAHVYLGQQDVPSWVGSFEVDVREMTPAPTETQPPTRTPTGTPTYTPTPTSTPTATPVPTLQGAVTTIMDNVAIVILLLILVSGSMGMYMVQRNRKGDRDQVANSEDEYNLEAIRALLLAAFTAETLRRLCQDQPLFRPIFTEFGPGHGLDDMIDRVVDYCSTQDLWKEFLAEVERKNPRQYRRYERKLRR